MDIYNQRRLFTTFIFFIAYGSIKVHIQHFSCSRRRELSTFPQGKSLRNSKINSRSSGHKYFQESSQMLCPIRTYGQKPRPRESPPAEKPKSLSVFQEDELPKQHPCNNLLSRFVTSLCLTEARGFPHLVFGDRQASRGLFFANPCVPP